MKATLEFDLNDEHQARMYKIASHASNIQQFFYEHTHDLYESFLEQVSLLSNDKEDSPANIRFRELAHIIEFLLVYMKSHNIEFLLEKNPDKDSYYENSDKILEWRNTDKYFEPHDYEFDKYEEKWKIKSDLVYLIRTYQGYDDKNFDIKWEIKRKLKENTGSAKESMND